MWRPALRTRSWRCRQYVRRMRISCDGRNEFRLNVKKLRTIFGFKTRPYRNRKNKSPRLEVVVETPNYSLTIFKLHFGLLTLKAYTKGERVLRFEAIVHNTKELGCRRLLERFPHIIVRLRQILEQFLENLYCMDASFISDETLDRLPTPTQVGKTRVGGIDLNKPRTRAVLSAALALACSPDGFTADSWRTKFDPRGSLIPAMTLAGRLTISKNSGARSWSAKFSIPVDTVFPRPIRKIAALVILRERVLRPILAGVGKPKMGRKPKNWAPPRRTL